MNSITNMFRSLENKSKKYSVYEGFDDNSNQLAEQANNVLSKINNENNNNNYLQNEYNSLLLEYQKKIAELSDGSSGNKKYNNKKYNNRLEGNNIKNQELSQLKTRIDQISQQLLENTEKINMDEINISNQSLLQNQSIENYLNEYKNNNKKIHNFGSNTNMDSIVNDSDINVLKENYNYYFWSILAIGAVLVSMNIVKN